MRLEMIEGQDTYEGKFQQTERKLHVVDGDEDYHPQNNFTWTFVSLTEEGVNLKVDFDEPTAVSRTPTAIPTSSGGCSLSSARCRSALTTGEVPSSRRGSCRLAVHMPSTAAYTWRGRRGKFSRCRKRATNTGWIPWARRRPTMLLIS